MVGDDDEDDLWLLLAVGALLEANQKGILRLLPATFPVPRLLNQESQRVFDDIYESDNPFLFRDHFRMDTRVYDSLFDACAPFISNKIKYHREVLAVTLYWLGRAASCRDQVVKFGLAYSTAHKYRHYGLYAIISALHDIIQLPTTVPTDFVRDFPYFDQALVAIDGVHVPIAMSAEDTERCRNRKGWVSTNVLIASDWQLNAAYIYPGAEGDAHDSMVLARTELLQLIGDGMYVLADAGYALHPKVLTLFRGVRYHLQKDLGDRARRKNSST
ncbi:DDE superfamily endonuclease [Phytophthora infestans]|uniref:DDE superfamily endonuclease n=1 Tax=Phytophthora infestans TaxID=4787 RepID=A0A8S9U6F7_PHYIN|nr:DDE superfamily endonuclease [Phytophthora infestans]